MKMTDELRTSADNVLRLLECTGVEIHWDGTVENPLKLLSSRGMAGKTLKDVIFDEDNAIAKTHDLTACAAQLWNGAAEAPLASLIITANVIGWTLSEEEEQQLRTAFLGKEATEA